MAANNIYFPAVPLIKNRELKPYNFLLVDNKVTGLPVKIDIEQFFFTAANNNLIYLAFTALTDTPNSLGNPGDLLVMDSTGDALEFVTDDKVTKCFTIAMAIALG